MIHRGLTACGLSAFVQLWMCAVWLGGVARRCAGGSFYWCVGQRGTRNCSHLQRLKREKISNYKSLKPHLTRRARERLISGFDNVDFRQTNYKLQNMISAADREQRTVKSRLKFP